MGLIPGWGRSPGGGNGNLIQYSCLGNPMDRGAWWATVQGVSESEMTGHEHKKKRKLKTGQQGHGDGSRSVGDFVVMDRPLR